MLSAVGSGSGGSYASDPTEGSRISAARYIFFVPDTRGSASANRSGSADLGGPAADIGSQSGTPTATDLTDPDACSCMSSISAEGVPEAGSWLRISCVLPIDSSMAELEQV